MESVSVALLAERGTFCYAADSGWTPQKIASEIEDMGFEAEEVKPSSEPGCVTLSVYGMTCASCVQCSKQLSFEFGAHVSAFSLLFSLTAAQAQSNKASKNCPVSPKLSCL